MNELIQLARRINDREDVIQAGTKRLLDDAVALIPEALLQGQDLLAAKAQMPHGQWLPWLLTHCKKVGERQAQRYMLLAANPTRVSEFLKAGSLRQALALLEDKPEQEEKEPRRWPPYLEAIGRLTKLVGYVDRFPLRGWPPEGLEKFREDLAPIVRQLWPDKFP